MFGTLLESKAARARRSGGMMLSVASHAAIVCGAILVAGRQNVVTAGGIPLASGPVVRYVAPATQPRRQSSGEGLRTATSRGLDPVIHAPSPIQLGRVLSGLPDIDISLAAPGGAADGIRWCSQPAECTLARAPRREGMADASGAASLSDLLARMVGAPPAPRYPESMRAAGLSGRVLVQFTIDTTGRIDAQSVRVLETTHEQFSRAVLDVLPRLRFVPAEVNGRRTRMAAQMPFEFTLERR